MGHRDNKELEQQQQQQKYGTLVGNVRHGTLKGTNIVNGVRFATFAPKPRASVPSYVRTPDGQVMFRVFYHGQPETCRHCSSTGHVARDCPQARRPNGSSTSRRWESVNNTASPSESKNGSNNNKETGSQDTPQTKADNAPRGSPGLPLVFLPASINKKEVFAEYKKAEARTIRFKTFCRYWQIHGPQLVIIKLHSDICYICDKNHEALL